MSGRCDALVIRIANHSSPAVAAVDQSQTSDRMTLIGRCRDGLSRALRVASRTSTGGIAPPDGVRRRVRRSISGRPLGCSIGCSVAGAALLKNRHRIVVCAVRELPRSPALSTERSECSSVQPANGR